MLSGGSVAQAEIGIIGGSGLYSMPGLSRVKEVRVKTPFGAPSDAYVCGTLEGRKVAFLARHGRGHRIRDLRGILAAFTAARGMAPESLLEEFAHIRRCGCRARQVGYFQSLQHQPPGARILVE